MTWPEGAAPGGRRLDPAARTILLVWALVVVGLGVLLVVSARDLDGWEGLVAAIYIVFAVIALVAIGVSALVIRGMIVVRTSQILAAVLLPPGLTMAAIAVLSVIG
jgi:hypothetical protein